MNVFILHAHENESSYCSSLKNRAVEYFSKIGAKVTVSDLYKMNFNPVASKNDFKSLSGEEYYKIQKEQFHAYKNNLFSDDIKIEMQKFEEADLVILNFPIWWYSVPAILKGWIDRVFAVGFAYGGGKGVYENGIFRNKKAFLTITTGGPLETNLPDGSYVDLNSRLLHINYGMLHFVGMKVLEPFVVNGPARLSNEDRIKKFDEYENYLKNLDSANILFH